MKIPRGLKPGDVIAFSGRNWISAFINLFTFGVPLWSISHVGIVAFGGYYGHEFDIVESTGKGGVRRKDLWWVIENYKGRVWVYKLSRPLYLHEMTRFMARTQEVCGRPYDRKGAMSAGGAIVSLITALFRRESLTTLFCSELVAELLSYIGVFPTANASRWSPNRLVRRLRLLGIVEPPEKIK